jgi:hypothetical protein
MSQASILQAVLYNTEASFCENAATFATALPLVDTVDLSGLARKKVRNPHIKSYMSEAHFDNLAPYDEQKITLKGRMVGLGATCTGAVPSSDLWTFLGILLGTTGNGLATGTTATGGTAATPTTTAASGAAGAMVRMGAVGDGRGGGQWLAINTHSSNSMATFIAAPAAPNAGDVIYSSKVLYPTDDPGETPTSIRLEILTSNGHFILRGCGLAENGFRITGSMPGGVLDWEADVVVSHVTTTSTTFPSATVPQRHAGGPALVNGSVAIQQVGTTTRATEITRELSLAFNIGCQFLKGPAGVFEGQVFTGFRRVSTGLTITMVVDAEATGTHTWAGRFSADPNTAALYWQVLISILVHDGRGLGLYAGRCKLVDVEPMQMAHEGFNRVRLTFEATTRTTESSAQRRANWMLAGS